MRPPPAPLDADAADADGVMVKRVIAFFIDVLCIALLYLPVLLVLSLASLLSLGILSPLVAIILALVPVAYHSLLIAGPWSATFGQRMMDLSVRSISGGRPSLGQAAINAITFYTLGSITGWVITLVALTNRQRRCLHDFLAGTVVVNRTGRSPLVFDRGTSAEDILFTGDKDA
ncbi:RDD family protein [Rhodospirillum rubrum]|uniref:RDD n=2 Tax=Rhodospirillum rubrum TaxID=1085 RepID=Q2RTA1_RHORT|nr:RDD family protein [Rhodospirillum rubrum]ABC22644.1 RDD [Rhodospirillum rubrum ATCC 11170]AEO48362.1 hypothetical protein F11_09480 [Rhodospirillum rubrum F11]MBK5954241.1 RDD family protein [Rhodospirillum rubrum]QXG82266.1 RDD family protein [Rhodospirillum rubrum]HAQ00162.1 RDD family protein [Rhodospirillum rubrum]